MNPSEPASLLPSLPPGAEILIIRLRSLGDVVLLTPALAALKEWRPDLQLSVLVEPAFAPLLEGHPAVSELMLCRGFAATAREIRRRRFSVVFNQHGGPTSAFLSLASGARVRVCWAHCQFPVFYNVLVTEAFALRGQKRIHTVEHRMSQFWWTGLPRGPIPPARIVPQPAALAAMEQKLAARGISASEPCAVLHPGAAFATRRWPAERFADLLAWLRTQHKLPTVVVLGPGDAEIAEAVKQHLAPRGVLLDSLSLPELIALISRARLFIGHDTGPAHMAAALGRPVVMIFGSSSPDIWRPWQVPHRVVQNDYPCNPCPGDRCYAFDVPHCILSVAPEQVRAACEALLRSSE